MRSQLIFLLLYSGAFGFGVVYAQQNGACAAGSSFPADNCTAKPDPTANFLKCVGVPQGPEAGRWHILNLKGLIDATLDIYSFMHSSLNGVPLLNISGEFSINWSSLQQDNDFIRFWLQARLTPMLSSMSQNFLTCMSNTNFSCSSYQTIVQELSQHFSGLDPERQKWIYSFFMYPFLSRNTSAGCVDPDISSEDWLIKNFGSFSVLARIKDLTSINLQFNGLEVLNLLSPQQKAELVLHPELVGLDNDSVSVVLDSLLTSVMTPNGSQTPQTNGSMWLPPIYGSSLQDPVQQVMNNFMTTFKPIGSFVKEFVSLTHQPDLSSMRTVTFVQTMLNWSLSELAAHYKQNSSVQTDVAVFDPTDVNAWFFQVVAPILRRFLPGDIPNNLTEVFHALFYIEKGGNFSDPDLCKVTLEEPECAVNNLIQHVASILHCAVSSNLTLTTETLDSLALQLTANLNTLLNQLAMTNFSAPDSPFIHILDRLHDLSPNNLQDPQFIHMWVNFKLLPRLPSITPEYLLCLSAKPFSCVTYQIIVMEMSNNMFLMSESVFGLVYQNFIHPFLSGQTATDGCRMNSSSEWIQMNLAGFSGQAPLIDLYLLNGQFDALEALNDLTPKQTAELLLENFLPVPQKQVIDAVFDFLLEAPEDRNLLYVLDNLVILSQEQQIECSSIQLIVQRLYSAVVPLDMKQMIQSTIDSLSMITPPDCPLLPPETCVSITVNESEICAGVNGTEPFAQMNVSCDTNVLQLACSQVTGLTPDALAHLLNCSLANNITYSKETWKLLFMKADSVLNETLLIISRNMTFPISGQFVSDMLEVIADVRLGQISAEDWDNVDFISGLFGHGLRQFLPYLSRDLLYCISSKNFSCQTYQLILKEFSDQILSLSKAEKQRVLKDFIMPFLSKYSTDLGCVSSTEENVEWLVKNLGPFADLLTIIELLTLNPKFDPMFVLPKLTSLQLAELIVVDIPKLPHKDDTINRVFDYLLQAPLRLPEVLQDILMMLNQMPCSSFTELSRRLFWAVSLVPQDLQLPVLQLATQLERQAPQDCQMTPLPTCSVTSVDENQICSGVSRPSLEELVQDLLNGSCTFSLEQYACSQLDGYTGEDLAHVMNCGLNSNTSYAKALWKLLFIKTDIVLDEALAIFSNMVGNKPLPISGVGVSNVLDMIREVRLDQLTPDQWTDNALISSFLGQNLRPYLSSVSTEFLSCIVNKNLSCQTFQDIVQEFSSVFSYMDVVSGERKNVARDFIQPFMQMNTSDPACVSNTTDVDWLLKNFGPFSGFFTLKELISFKPGLNPIRILPYLTPSQMAELMVLDVPGISNNEAITAVFHFLIESSQFHKMTEVLNFLSVFSHTVTIPCTSYTLIFTLLYNSLTSVPSDMHPEIWNSINGLMQTSPNECLPPSLQCPDIVYNETQMCQGVDSSELEALIATGGSAESFCRFSIQNYSCANLASLTAFQLSTLLQCELNSSVIYSKEVWKLFFTKVINILDSALVYLAKMSTTVEGPNVPIVLEVLSKLRLSQFTPEEWGSGEQVSGWMANHLAPFLPSASGVFLYCLSSKNLTCKSYQNILTVFSNKFSAMNQETRELVLKYYIGQALSNSSLDGCINYNNTKWLLSNFGPFSQLSTLKQLMKINRNFNPLQVLPYLTPLQTAELMTENLTGLPNKVTIINTVFDFLLEPAWQHRFPEVLHYLSVQAGLVPLSCEIYQTIFSRLERILSSSPGSLEPVVWASVYDLRNKAPAGCVLFPVDYQCPATSFNVSAVCGVQSSIMQQSTLTAPCNLTIQEYACATSLDLSSDELLCVLENALINDSAPATVEAWKLFLTRVSDQLDSALLKLSSNATQFYSKQASNFLDAVRELRIDRFTSDDLVNSSFISLWFSERLAPLLTSASATFLSCMSSKNFSCQTYQTLVQIFSTLYPVSSSSSVGRNQSVLVYHSFIYAFLNAHRADLTCQSTDSASWLINNFRNFRSYATLREVLHLNPQFNPLVALSYLSPAQMTELLISTLPELPANDVIINAVFDYLSESPEQRGLASILTYLSYTMNALQPNVSCSSYRIIFRRLDYLFPSVPVDLESVIVQSKSVLLQHVPAGCDIYSGECNITQVNESAVCTGVNSSALAGYLAQQHDSSQICTFTITQYACTQLTGLTPKDLVVLLSCKLSDNSTVSDQTWKLFITNVNPILGPALDLFSNTTLSWSRPLVSVLDMIGEVTLSSFSSSNYRNSSFIQRWFEIRLRPFLPYATPHFLDCLASKDFNCTSFQNVVEIFAQQYDALSNNTALYIYVDFIRAFLSLNQTAGCAAGVQSSDWLKSNFGPFFAFASLSDLQKFNPSFNPLDVLDTLTLNQLVQVASTPALLNTPTQVNKLMDNVADSELYLFFNDLSKTLSSQRVQLIAEVQQAFLQQVLNRAHLSDPAVPNAEVQVWLSTNLRPLISAITAEQLPQYFSAVQSRPCTLSQQAVALLNSFYSSFSADIQQDISNEIITSLKSPSELRCYANGSFYVFLQSTFMSFQLPSLSGFLNLMPSSRQSELLNSISPAELYSFLSQTNTTKDMTLLCQIFSNYQRTPEYLQKPVISDAVGRQTLKCVWSQALNASSQAKVDEWFTGLVQYLPFLNSELIQPEQLLNASCLAFRKFVLVMGTYDYKTDFTQQDVYSTIQTYLTTDSTPKCYNSLDPVLNSTSWFVDYIGPFISFITVEDLMDFGDTYLEIFTVDPKNLQLFQKFTGPMNVTNYYVDMLYEFSPSFSAALLPPLLRCSAPADAFTALNSSEVTQITETLYHYCTDIDPSVSAALAKYVDSVTSASLSALGNSSVGLSTGQISNTSPAVLMASLKVLNSVVGWNQGQTLIIIKALLSTGYQITSINSLLDLGTLVSGIPSSIFISLTPQTLKDAIQTQSFLTNIITAPSIVQQSIVNQIISVNSSSDVIVNTIPSTMSTLIPRNTLLTLTQSSAAVLNQKQWSYEQSMLFFDTVVSGNLSEDSISFQVLQGFTCTRVQSFETEKVRKLIKGCRRRGNTKVTLRESQLTCMHNYISTETVTVFTDYPPELLLYYNYSLVNQSLCQAYFTALGYANFSVLSGTLAFKKQVLLQSALQCLGVSGFNISRSQLDVLGNMVCMLNSTYITNSDLYVLEKLKWCQDLSSAQSSAAETILLTRSTSYSTPSSWTITTLKNLGLLPLYFSSTFWTYFSMNEKSQFMKTFMPTLMGLSVSRERIDSLLTEARQKSKSRSKLIIRNKRDTACTVGNITQVQVNEESFPLEYDASQFSACLSVQTLKDNLAALADKIMGSDYQRIVLDKLNQAYPAGISDQVLQVLGPASRAATATDISKWNITQIDTLSALMKSYDGAWSSDQVKAIVNKYLNVSGNTLSSSVLNSLGGANLCALDLSVLNTITSSSLQSANALSVSNCSLEQKQALFTIAQSAFSSKALNPSTKATSTVSANSYQLIMSYLGGADLSYVRTLSASNISMDLTTFTSLNPTVVNSLSVNEVKSLLGSNLATMKTYENNTVVQNWISRQLQSELNTLGIGLTGGRATAATVSSSSSSSSAASTASTATTASTASTATTAKPSASGLSVHPLSKLQQLLLLAVVMATMKLMN